MNSQNAAAAIRKVAEGLYELADTLFDSQAVALPPATPAHAGAAPARAGLPPAPASEPSPFENEAVTWEPPDNLEPVTPALSERDRVMAECPVHFTPWKVKESGISRNGKPYSAFWKCNGKNDDGSYCSKKPEPGWVKTHDPEKALAAA